MLVDTHAHLNFPDYQKDLDQIIDQSIKNGVGKIICVSSNTNESEKAIKLAQKHKGIVFAAVGIHPHQTDPKNADTPEEQIKKLAKLAKNKNVVAIGESGLDFSPAPPSEKDRSQKEQLFLFKAQIKIARREKLPILVHCREAFQDVVKILQESLPLKGVFHCYSAGKKGIAEVEKLGFYFGVCGNLTYDTGLQNVFLKIPLEKILLETDCPFLSPDPKRGKRNEPANIRLIAEVLASLKGESYQKVVQITTQNAETLLNSIENFPSNVLN